jgi:uncharacterized protein YjbJ (UPF0337 family)
VSRRESRLHGEGTLDKDRIEGSAKAAKGSLKEAIGQIVGNDTTRAQGAAEKASGEAQKASADAKPAARRSSKT